jgi:hypothetical protein
MNVKVKSLWRAQTERDWADEDLVFSSDTDTALDTTPDHPRPEPAHQLSSQGRRK